MITVDYTNAASLRALARHLDGMMPAQKSSAAKRIVECGLMNPTGAAGIIRAIFGKTVFGAAVRQMVFKDQKMGLDIWDETMKHMLKGRDKFDPKSAGGFSKEELQQLSQIVRSTGFETFQVREEKVEQSGCWG